MRRELGMLVALVVLSLVLWLSNSDFLAASNVVNLARRISMLGIFSIGIAFVIITGGIDLSIGSVVGLTGVIIARLSSTATGGLGYPLWVGVAVALGVACLVGLMQGLLITRLKLQPFIVTLGFMLLLRGVSQTVVEGGMISMGKSPLLDLSNGGLFMIGGYPLLPYPLLIFLVVAGAGAYVLHFTVLGRYIYAIGGNRAAAEYSGIAVNRIETMTYVISAASGAVAGVLYCAEISGMSHKVGESYELYAIAAVVLGGCSLRGGEGTILGILIGASMTKVIDNGINMFQFPYVDADGVRRIWRLNTNWTNIIFGAVILAAVILDQVVHMVQAARALRKTTVRKAVQQQAIPAKNSAA
jgi:ribose transport system permease protein